MPGEYIHGSLTASVGLVACQQPRSTLFSKSEKNPKELLKDSRGYSLVRQLRDEMARRYSARPTAVYISTLLRELPAELPNLAERTYLDEALACFNAGAFRASIVMCWNLAYEHFCEFVLSKHLTDFKRNSRRVFPKRTSAR
jgi:hypothetical protein